MPNLDKRIAALEQAAKLRDAQSKTKAFMNINDPPSEEFMRKLNEILTRVRPKLTHEEQVKKFREQVTEMKETRATWVNR